MVFLFAQRAEPPQAERCAPDGGSVTWIQPRLSRSYLSQEGQWNPQQTLGSQLQGVPSELLSRCGITQEMQNRPAGSLSGGQKVRAALAQALATSPQVLLLDEPTNHLTAEGLAWLEGLLASYPGSVLVVSHDRYLLRRVATRVLALEGGKVSAFPGSYEEFLGQKNLEERRGSGGESTGQQTHERRLLIQMRLAELGAALASAPPEQAQSLQAEFIRLSRELRGLGGQGCSQSSP